MSSVYTGAGTVIGSAVDDQGHVPDIRAGKGEEQGRNKYLAKRVAAAITTLGFSELYDFFDNRENSSSERHKEYLVKKQELAELAEAAVLKEGDDLVEDQEKMQKLAQEVAEAGAKDMAKQSESRNKVRELLVRVVADGLTLGAAELVNAGSKVKTMHHDAHKEK